MNIQRKLLTTEEVMKQIWEQIALASEGLNDKQRLLAEFTREAQERDNLMKSLLALHEKEMGVVETAASPLQLTKQQTETLVSELKTLEEIPDIGVRGNKVADVTDLITPSLFRNFADAVEEKCPLLRNRFLFLRGTTINFYILFHKIFRQYFTVALWKTYF